MLKTFKPGWHVIYVRSCQEKKVYQLLQEIKIESFLPMVETVKQWSDRKKTILKPLLPSYVFVNINSLSEFHRALSVDGACTYIRFGTEYALITEKEIEQMKFLIGIKGITDIEVRSDVLKIGEKVKVTYGALSGLECEVLRVNNQRKVCVSLNSLKQNIVAFIPSNFLQSIVIE